ncbi:MAG TPA: hypothetical protein VFO66_01040 [Gemmatimonadaceae bacterium]|nr:hypothetical protein [Gemmatimonadaceae bacterium]
MLSLSSRNHVPIAYREIESHEHNVAAQTGPQSRTFPEKFGLSWWLLHASRREQSRALS